MPLEIAAFSGCGVRLTAYAGAVKSLARNEQFVSITTLLGTSGGAITALLLSVGYTSEQLEKLIFSLDYYKEVSDSISLLSELHDFCSKGGLYRAEHLQRTLMAMIEQKTGSANTTFLQLHEMMQSRPQAMYRNLIIIAMNLNAANNPLTVFSHETTPNIRLIDAALASASAPLYFTPHAFNFPMAGGEKLCYFADGGIVCNDPFAYYVNEHVKDKTLYRKSINFVIGTAGELLDKKTYKPFTPSIFHNATQEVNALITASEYVPLSNPAVLERTVFIDPKGISSMELKLTKAQKLALIDSGDKATQDFLDRHPELGPLSRLTSFSPIDSRDPNLFNDPLLQPSPPPLTSDLVAERQEEPISYLSYLSRCTIL
jgi:NTE family protein